MTMRAKFDGRVFVPDEPVALPGQARVRLRVIPEAPANAPSTGDPLDAFIGRFETGIPDLADRHDAHTADVYTQRRSEVLG